MFGYYSYSISHRRRLAAQFYHSETGAVTVDWVVLTAALVGLGLAVLSVVGDGIGNAANATSDALSNTSATYRFALRRTFSTDFSSGTGGWLGGSATTLSGFGDVLQLGPGEGTQFTFDIPPGAEEAVITFDIIAGDDLDRGDTATVLINGEVVSIYEDNHGRVSVSGNAPQGITVDVTHQAINDPIGAGGHGHDSVSTYAITVSNPGTNVTVGVNSGANGPTSEEFYALDNVDISTS